MAYTFWGHYQHTLDSKNRVAIPAKFRLQIDDGKVIVTRHWGGCLVVFPEAEWMRLIGEELAGLNPLTDPAGLRVERMYYGNAFACEIDKQGRISLSAHHLKQAGIGREVVFKGLNNKFEIWDPKRWDAWEKDQLDDTGGESS
jgi:MraZ protein